MSLRMANGFGQLALIAMVSILGCDKPDNFLYFHPDEPIIQKVIPPGSLQGTVVNAVNGRALPGVKVVVRPDGDPAHLEASVHTDANGFYIVHGLAEGVYVVDYTLANFSSITDVQVPILQAQITTMDEFMSTPLDPTQIRVVLTWCNDTPGAVRDIDSYLHVPGEDPRRPIGYQHLTNSAGVKLDIDDTSWKGPETITISTLIPTGTYQYYINNYNLRRDPLALGNSSATIYVYQGVHLVKTYTVPPGFGITYEVFDIVNGVITDVEAYNSTLPTY